MSDEKQETKKRPRSPLEPLEPFPNDREPAKQPACEPPKCNVCSDVLALPVSTCDRHMVCYECAWNLVTVNPRERDWGDAHISLSNCCPFCLDNKVHLFFEPSGKPCFQGIRRLPDELLSHFWPGAEYKCPFCDYTNNIYSLYQHVDECGARTAPCPRAFCQSRFSVAEGWAGHTRTVCTGVHCKQPGCEYRSSQEGIQRHQRTHTLLNVLSTRLRAMTEDVRRFDVGRDADYAADPQQFDANIQLFLDQFPNGNIINTLTALNKIDSKRADPAPDPAAAPIAPALGPALQVAPGHAQDIPYLLAPRASRAMSRAHSSSSSSSSS